MTVARMIQTCGVIPVLSRLLMVPPALGDDADDAKVDFRASLPGISAVDSGEHYTRPARDKKFIDDKDKDKEDHDADRDARLNRMFDVTLSSRNSHVEAFLETNPTDKMSVPYKNKRYYVHIYTEERDKEGERIVNHCREKAKEALRSEKIFSVVVKGVSRNIPFLSPKELAKDLLEQAANKLFVHPVLATWLSGNSATVPPLPAPPSPSEVAAVLTADYAEVQEDEADPMAPFLRASYSLNADKMELRCELSDRTPEKELASSGH